MDVFRLRDSLVDDYRRYTSSFLAIRDTRIRRRVDSWLAEGRLWPEARLSLNPTFASGGFVDDLVSEGVLPPTCRDIFRAGKEQGSSNRGTPVRLHRHQAEAIRRARAGRELRAHNRHGFGESLAYIVPMVDHVLRAGSGGSVKGIVVYPMNALANSQRNELESSSPPALRSATRRCASRHFETPIAWTSITVQLPYT